MTYAQCPECGEKMFVDYVNNGVGMVWHGVHCGWGHDGLTDEDIKNDEAAKLFKEKGL